MKFLALREADAVDLYGGKAVNLGSALRSGLPVPDGVAVSVAGVDGIAKGDSEVLAALRQTLTGVNFPIAVRSSAIDEDSKEASFAGQHVSILNLHSETSVVDAISEVRASGRSDAVLAYRQKRGLQGLSRIAVVLQELVDPVCAGVMFTSHPVTGADERVIEAAWGLGEAVVAGLVTPDSYQVDRSGKLTKRTIGHKDIKIGLSPDGGTRETEVTPESVDRPCLKPEALRQLHGLATRCEELFGKDLDIEWAFTNEALYLLQCRAISTVVKTP